jgi:FtsH-binding integral membrane protein
MYALNREGPDVGLRQYMTSIYNLMLMGLLVSAGAAWFATSSGLLETLQRGGLLFWVVALSPLGLVLAMSLGVDRMRLTTLHLLYWTFVVLEGLGLSVILSRYTGGSILTAFLASAVGFGGCSLYGYTTKRDLGPIGTFLIFALFGLIALMILNIFIPSTGLNLFIGLAGILIFAGLTAWDTQTLKLAYHPTMDSDGRGRIVVMGALNLYLDFLNMFLFILRLAGVKKD